jgi:lactoylglutathione lyase
MPGASGLTFGGAFPVLAVADLNRALRFYVELLGGVEIYRFPPEGEAGFVSLQLSDGSKIGLGADPSTAHRANSALELCVYASDGDAAADHLRAAGVTIVDEPADQPWGERLARVEDPDGNRITLLSRA